MDLVAGARPDGGSARRARGATSSTTACCARARATSSTFTDTFDYLYTNEPIGFINGIHGHFGGRPLMTAMLRRVLQYFQGFPDVWFARHGEIAQWMIDAKVEEPSYAKRFFE